MKKENKLVLLIIGVLILIDQITKLIFLSKSWTIPNQDNGYHIIISLIIIIMIFRYIFSDNSYIKLETKIVLSCAIAGAVSNVIDRLWKHSVILIINLGHNIEINLAYFYILIAWIGMAVILTKNTMKIIKERKRKAERIYKKHEDNNK